MSLFRNNRRKWAILGLLILLAYGCRMYFKAAAPPFTAQPTAASLERGRNLTYNVCGSCHYDERLQRFSGKPLHDLPKIAGRLYSANLTHSETHGIPPRYTDAQLFYLLKTGIGKTGRFMPYMMRPMMADDDINDIIVYLRSGDPAVAAADTTVGTTHINLIGKVGIRHLASPQPFTRGVPRPAEQDPVAYGRYLVAVIACYHCHSQKVRWLNYRDAEKTKGYLAGGMKLKDPQGNRLYSPNLTPDKETGIGNFSLADFRRALTEGLTPSGRKLSPPMPRFTHLTPGQIGAIYAYLQSRPPVRHAVKGRGS